MKLADESKGKHWLTLVTTWSNRRLYTALASASRALLACSTLSGTLQNKREANVDVALPSGAPRRR